MATLKRTYKLDEETIAAATALAKEKHTSITAIINDAVRYYRDYVYMEEKASFIPQQFVQQINAILELREKRQNAKVNQVLSELAIQECIVAFILANNIDIPLSEIDLYRKKAVEFLRINNRVFRLEESEIG